MGRIAGFCAAGSPTHCAIRGERVLSDGCGAGAVRYNQAGLV